MTVLFLCCKQQFTVQRASPDCWGGPLRVYLCSRRFSMCPDWITGGLGSPTSQGTGFFSSSFMAFHPGFSIPRMTKTMLFQENREALNHSARAGGERFFPSRRFRKRWNPVWISRFLNRTDGGKDPLPSRRRIVQRFHSFCRNNSFTAGSLPGAKGLSSPASSKNARK